MFLFLACVSLGAACGSKDESTSSTTSAAAGTGGGGGGSPSCEAYCTAVMTNCTADNAVYASMAICMGACATMPDGTEADTTGDTIGCRTYHAGAAKADPKTHCQHAGPGGADFCGKNCDGYCQLAMAACPTLFAAEADCMAACATFPSTGQPFSVNDVTGNTIECRLYHASVATTDKVHCAHIGAMPSAAGCVN